MWAMKSPTPVIAFKMNCIELCTGPISLLIWITNKKTADSVYAYIFIYTLHPSFWSLEVEYMSHKTSILQMNVVTDFN